MAIPAKTIGKISAEWTAGMKLQHRLFLFQYIAVDFQFWEEILPPSLEKEVPFSIQP